MTRSKSIIGALVLCALSICAFGAASASATGLTAVQCEAVAAGTGKYNAHCPTPKVEKGNFETVVIPKNTPKAVEGKDTRTISATEHGLGNTANPVAVFHATVNAIETTVTCGAGRTTGGTLENIEEGEMKIKTTGASVVWTECHASPKTKPTKICTVQGLTPPEAVGSIGTNPLGSKTKVETGAEHKVVITPENAEKVFTKFKINASGGECYTAAALEALVTGEAWGRANTETHSHLTLDEKSNELSPLRANGAPASQTETVTGFTKGNEELTVGAETF